MKVTKISIGRLFNLGSYEHVRYEITAEVTEGESARATLVGLEKIIEALAPENKACVHTQDDLNRELRRVETMTADLSKLTADAFKFAHGYFEGTPEEYVARCRKGYEENLARRTAWEKRSAKARELLDSLGGAETWKDAKLDWENDDEY